MRFFLAVLVAGAAVSAGAGCRRSNPAYVANDGAAAAADTGDVPSPADRVLSELEIGLVGYWKLDDGAGSGSARDSSDSGATGQLRDLDPQTSWIQGKLGSALRFVNKGWVRVPFHDGLNTITTAVTIAAWVYNEPPGNGDTSAIAVRQVGTGSRRRWYPRSQDTMGSRGSHL